MPEEEHFYMRLKRVEDLVMIVLSPMAPSYLCHTEKAGKHMYFAILPVMGKAIVCYVEAPQIKKKYAVLNTITHEVTYSDEFSTDPTKRHVLVIDVADQNLIK
ncbi:MAG: hypothetical protein WED04_05885 [Promethearchaeati archaeon SRVP18_Atabeyarchaeia-1]